MAVSITQQPTSPNVAFTKLLFVVSGSDTTSNDQYKYVCDLSRSGSSEIITRLKTIKNEEGVGVFDISVFIQNDLLYDETWKASPSLPTTQSAHPYIIKFGEEYGTSPSSSVTLYDGAGSEGDPSIESNDLYLFRGVINPADINSFNFNNETFDTGSFTSENFNDVSSVYGDLRGPRLSNYPYGYQNYTSSVTTGKPIGFNDYETISFERVLSSSSYIYSTSSLDVYNTDGGLYSTVLETSSPTIQDIVTLGVGPQNLIPISSGISSSFTSSWGAYKINLTYESGGSSVSQSYWYYNDDLDLESASQVYTPPIPSSFGAWSTGNRLNEAKANGDSSGDLSNGALVFGGVVSTNLSTNRTSRYNPSTQTWGVGNNLPDTTTNGITGGGSFTSNLAVGGDNHLSGMGVDHTDRTTTWNGSSWVLETNYPTQVAYAMSAITSENNAFVFGGEMWNWPYYERKNDSHTYNGSSWTSGGNLLSYRYNGIGLGTPTSALVIGGFTAGTPTGTLTLASSTEEYNGSVWSSGPNYPHAVTNLAAVGTTSNALIYGGRNADTPRNYLQGQKWTFSYNGTSFSTKSDLLVGLTYHMGGGDADNAFAVGGGYNNLGSVNPVSDTTTYLWDSSTVNPTIPGYITYIFGGQILEGMAADKCYDKTRFAWINQYGYWDYYSIYNPIIKNTRSSRENVKLPQANYSSTTSVYDISRRSNTQYYESLDDSIRITTNYLDQDEANWLTELFESPFAFEQIDNGAGIEFVPIVITNSQYNWNTEGRNNLFQYTFEYKRANQRRSRL